MPEIGDQLRESRMRNRVDITEVEAATKIRAKYLRALENEEWDLLPGPTFVKTFLRTYAEYLGLDARNLVEEYRSRYERPAQQELTPFGAQPRRPPGAAAQDRARAVDGRARRHRRADRGAAPARHLGRRRPDEQEAERPDATPEPTAAPARGRGQGAQAQARAARGRPGCRSGRPGRSACAWRTPPGRP